MKCCFRSFTYEEIRPLLGEDNPRIPICEWEGEMLTAKPDSLRLLCLKRSPVCVRCGRRGVEFRAEIHPGKSKLIRPHLGLYSEDGVLMTKDHIIPRRDGGPDHLDNLQTMCKPCNEEKD